MTKRLILIAVGTVENSSYVPNMAVYFSSLSTITVDYILTTYYDSNFLSFYLWATLWSVLGSVICIVLNSLLIICVFTIDDFKNWVFFPVCLQAFIDIAGPGFAKIVYNVISFNNLRDELSLAEYLLSEDFEKFTIVDGKIGCTLTFFRSFLNEYTTGYCVLASAFFRYCLICHPTASISSTENLRKCSWAIVPVISLILTLSFCDMRIFGRQISNEFNTDIVEGWEKFTFNCQFFIYRNNIQRPILSRDITLFFFVPASISAFFYIRIFIVLRGRERNQNRNRNLIVAFVLNWILWVFCWTIYYTTMSIKLGYDTKRKLTSDRTLVDLLEERLSSSKEHFCLLYSQLNPVFFLIILKPFQKRFLDFLKLTISSNQESFGLLKKPMNLHEKHNSKPENAKQRKGILKKKLRTLCLVIFLLLLGSFVFNVISRVEVNSRLKHVEETCSSSRIQTRKNLQFQASEFLFFQDAFSAEFEDPRIKCGALKGVFSMKYKRCIYIAKSSEAKQLNLTEQEELCGSQKATLAYPTSFSEGSYLFRYYLFECGPDCRKNVSFESNQWFIRLGFHRYISENWRGFITFDGHLVIKINKLMDNYYDYDYSYNYSYDYNYDNETEFDHYNVNEYDYDYNYDYTKLYSKISQVLLSLLKISTPREKTI